MKKFDKKLAELIVQECENKKEEGWAIQKTTFGSSRWPRKCGPLTAVCLKSLSAAQLKTHQRYSYYGSRYRFDKEKVLKNAATILNVSRSWVNGFQSGISTRKKNPVMAEYMTRYGTKNDDLSVFEEGFWTGREVSTKLSAPAFDKKPAQKLLGKALRRAYKAGLTREDIRMVVDEYMAETILDQ